MRCELKLFDPGIERFAPHLIRLAPVAVTPPLIRPVPTAMPEVRHESRPHKP
jgi:hypothetical protein